MLQTVVVLIVLWLVGLVASYTVVPAQWVVPSEFFWSLPARSSGSGSSAGITPPLLAAAWSRMQMKGSNEGVMNHTT